MMGHVTRSQKLAKNQGFAMTEFATFSANNKKYYIYFRTVRKYIILFSDNSKKCD